MAKLKPGDKAPAFEAEDQDGNTAALADFAGRKVFVYFFVLGLGFLFLEIYFMQRFILFLSHPLYTAAVVLSSFLLFAGLGSRYSKRLAANKAYRRSARYGIFGIAVLGLFYLLTLDPIFSFLLNLCRHRKEPAVVVSSRSVLLLVSLL